MRIGISYWGFCEGFKHSTVSNTPDGHRFGRPLLIDALLVKGHKVFALQSRRENERYQGISYNNDSFPDLDVLFLEWRWPTYKNSGAKKFEGDLDRQLELLDYYHGKIPIIAWDTDLKMTIEDEQRWPEMIVADPSLDPKKLSRERIRLTFWSDFRSLLVPNSELAEFGYVGNNYERDDMFQKYYSVPAKALREYGIQTKVHGNWLQRSPERISPESLIKKHAHIAFGKRLSFQGSMHVLNELICTIHITKPEYAKRGFPSPRYVENLAVGTPGVGTK